MKATKAEQQALIAMLTRIYEEIHAVELQWDIRIDERDFRPRIEYFHDAVRALSLNDGKGSDGKGRLAVELLAYDISMLRFIQTNPLNSFQAPRKLSPKKDIMHNVPRTMDDKSGQKPDTAVKHQLIDLYKSYAVLFAALLSEPADRNYMSRISDANAEMDDLASLKSAVSEQGDVQIDLESLADRTVLTDDLMNKILTAFQNGNLAKKMRARDAEKKLKDMAQNIEKEKNDIEKAHFTFAVGQLAVYEGARDVVKKMAVRGLNIVGDFVENAVQDAKRSSRGM